MRRMKVCACFLFLALMVAGLSVAPRAVQAADVGVAQVVWTAKSLNPVWCNGITSPVIQLYNVNSSSVGIYYKTYGANPSIHRVLIEESPDGVVWGYPTGVSQAIGVLDSQGTVITELDLPPMKSMRFKLYCTPAASAKLDLVIYKR